MTREQTTSNSLIEMYADQRIVTQPFSSAQSLPLMTTSFLVAKHKYNPSFTRDHKAWLQDWIVTINQTKCCQEQLHRKAEAIYNLKTSNTTPTTALRKTKAIQTLIQAIHTSTNEITHQALAQNYQDTWWKWKSTTKRSAWKKEFFREQGDIQEQTSAEVQACSGTCHATQSPERYSIQSWIDHSLHSDKRKPSSTPPTTSSRQTSQTPGELKT